MRTNKVRITESKLREMIREAVKGVLNEISDDMKQSYINGRRAQERGERPMSNANINKGGYDLAKYKNQGYPCGGAQTPEEFARMQAGDKATQMYKNGRGKFSWGD